MECQGGQVACEGAKKAKVKVTIDDKVEHLIFDAPACVKEEKTGEASDSDIKCWRFWGTSNGTITFQHYACGKEAHYQPDSSLKNNGAWLIVDGVKQKGDGYYYWSGTDEFNVFNARFLSPVTKFDSQGKVSGDCDSCLITGCQITVTSEGGAVYKSKKGTKCSFEIACDENCPPHHVRCETNSYPGYCCMPCESTANKINNLANKIK
jgi:hypothetical protein